MMLKEFDDEFGGESVADEEAPFDSGGEELTGPPRLLNFISHDFAPRELHRAMILDDNPVTAAQLRALSERLLPGWALEMFTDLPAATQALIRGRFCAVFTDFNLQRGRTSEPLVRNALAHGIPSSHVVVWTGNALDAQEVMPAGVSVHQKPDVEALRGAFTMVRKLVEGRIGDA